MSRDTSPPGAARTDWERTLHDLDVGVVVQDRDLRITYVNPKATALLGLTADEFRERTTDDDRWDTVFTDGRSVQPHEHPGPRALASGEIVRGVIVGVKREADAERVWILVSAVPQRGADGAVDRVVISFSDVSDAQRALREQETTYQSVFQSMSEGLVIHNPDGTIRAANPSAARVLGLSLDQLMGRAATDPRWRLVTADGASVGPDDIPSEIAARTGKPSGPTVLGVYRPSGERAWLEVNAAPLRAAEDEALRGVIATFADITAERNTRLALEASRAQVQRVLDAVPGIVYQYQHRAQGGSGISFVAGRIGELLGVPEDEVRADPERLFEKLSPRERAALQESIARVVVTRERFEHELSFEHADGSIRWLRLFGVPDVSADDVIYTGVMLDVTAEKQMADALRLRQRREAMGDMAAGIAHNFNNMLAVILPNIQMAREGAAPELEESLADAERAARNAADLVRRMLALGRVDVAEARAQVDLVPIVMEALHICRQTFDRGISIEEHVGLDTALVRGSSSEMQQVLLNFCLNARDALQGVRNPLLSVSLNADGARAVVLTVRDTGIGMTEETLRRIGEPFFTTKMPGRGTGLGLASAFHTIAESGGTWSVLSSAGAGTTFSVRFPLATPTPRARVRITPSSAPALAGTVLIIDDEPMVRSALARQVTRAGMHADLVDGAEPALTALREGRVPNLRAIVLDLSMPGMSGAEALPLIRALAPNVPVIALSGHVPDDANLSDAAAVVGKPVGQQQLEDVLRTVLMR